MTPPPDHEEKAREICVALTDSLCTPTDKKDGCPECRIIARALADADRRATARTWREAAKWHREAVRWMKIADMPGWGKHDHSADVFEARAKALEAKEHE